ncbi:HIR complex subunit [Sorochytrium milnesiophthora]
MGDSQSSSRDSSLLLPLPPYDSQETLLGADEGKWWLTRSPFAVACVVGLTLFVDMVVYGVVVPILPMIASDKLGGDETAVGVLFGSYALGLLLCTPPIAYLSDRYNSRRAPMLAGLGALAVTTVMFAWATAYWQLLLARVMQGVAAGASWTVGLSMLADVYPNESLGRVMGPVLSCNHAGFLVGPVIGGWLYQAFGYSIPFYFCAALALVNFFLRLCIDDDNILHQKDRIRLLDEESPLLATPGAFPDTAAPPTSVGFWSLLAGRPIWTNCLLIVVVGGIFAGLEPTLPLHLQEQFHMEPGAIGSAFIALVVPSLLTAPLAGYLTDLYGGRTLVLASILLMAGLAPLVGQMTQIWSILIMLVLFGGCQSFAITPVVPAMARYVNEQGSNSYATIYGMFNLAYSVGTLFGPSLAGWVYGTVGFAWQMETIRILAPNFIQHGLSTTGAAGQVEHKQRAPIFSIDIHPDGTRVATGGNDHYVRLWSFAAIVNDAAYQDESVPKELYAGKRHDGAIMCVRWCNKNGRLLASAADDGTMVIWQMDKNPSHFNPLLAGGSSAKAYKENLAFVKKLPSMASDVIDLAWSPDNRLLASCSLDNAVAIWSGTTFERVATFTHDSFVKGLSFDPAGKYLVSQSDDGSATIWDAEKWSVVQRIKTVFVQGSSVALFKRPSWSPDGQFVACANAINNGCHVTASMQRGVWDKDGWKGVFNAVGHTAPISVVKFSPKMYMTEKGKIRTVTAVGSHDKRVSIWLHALRPVLVLEDVFVSDVTDFAWYMRNSVVACMSADGKTLLACAREGRVVGVQFPNAEAIFGGTLVPDDELMKRLQKNGLDVKTFSVLDFADLVAPLPQATAVSTHGQHASSTGSVNNFGEVAPTQQEVTTVNGKKRIRPVLVSSINTALRPAESVRTSNQAPSINSQQPRPEKRIMLEEDLWARRLPCLRAFKTRVTNPSVTKADGKQVTYHVAFSNQCRGELSRLSISVLNGPDLVHMIIKGSFSCAAVGRDIMTAVTSEPALLVWREHHGLLVPPVILSSQVSCMALSGYRIAMVCTDGTFQFFDFSPKDRLPSHSLSLSRLFAGHSDSLTLIKCTFTTSEHKRRTPRIELSNGTSYVYDPLLATFLRETATITDKDLEALPSAPAEPTGELSIDDEFLWKQLKVQNDWERAAASEYHSEY